MSSEAKQAEEGTQQVVPVASIGVEDTPKITNKKDAKVNEKKMLQAKSCYSESKQVEVASPHLSDSEFVRYFEKKVRQTIRKYKLLSPKENIAVACSGGKDSAAVLYVLKNLGYNVTAVTVDAKIGCYTEKNLENLRKMCSDLGVELKEISFREEFGMSLCYMKSILDEKGEEFSSCMVCGTLRRYLLNKYAKKWEFDKLVTGHNLDDEAQAFMMNVFRNDVTLARRQGPISGNVASKRFVTRVKPLYLLSEKEVIRYTHIKKFPLNYGICPCSSDAYRRNYINILDEFEKKHPSVKYNILKFHEGITTDASDESEEGISLDEINACESCGEPCSKEMCRACQLLKKLDKKVD